VNAAGARELSDLLLPVIDIARQAGRAILEVYGSSQFGTVAKADDSPLTQADLRAHALIVAALRALTPDIPVLSEESAAIPFAQRSGWLRHWLVDPLDGTKEFVARNGEFTVNIALIQAHAPVLGVVGVPVRDTVYFAAREHGAFRTIGNAAAAPIHVCKSAPVPFRVVASRSHRGDSLDAYLRALGTCEVVSVGSALKLCLVAEGTADIYPRLGPTSEWDTAAAHAVVAAAGGRVITRGGTELAYNTKTDLLNPDFFAFGDQSRDWLEPLRVVRSNT